MNFFSSSLFLKLGKLVREVIVTEEGYSPDLWALVKNCEFFQISSAMMHAIVKQIKKQRRQKVVMIKVHKFQLVIVLSLIDFAYKNMTFFSVCNFREPSITIPLFGVTKNP